jgi:hypothetical protein
LALPPFPDSVSQLPHLPPFYIPRPNASSSNPSFILPSFLYLIKWISSFHPNIPHSNGKLTRVNDFPPFLPSTIFCNRICWLREKEQLETRLDLGTFKKWINEGKVQWICPKLTKFTLSLSLKWPRQKERNNLQ